MGREVWIADLIAFQIGRIDFGDIEFNVDDISLLCVLAIVCRIINLAGNKLQLGHP